MKVDVTLDKDLESVLLFYKGVTGSCLTLQKKRGRLKKAGRQRGGREKGRRNAERDRGGEVRRSRQEIT